MKLNRRNFIRTASAAAAALAAFLGGLRNPPQPEEWPERVWRAATVTITGASAATGITVENVTTGRIIYVDGTRGKDIKPENGLAPETAYRSVAPALREAQSGDIIQIFGGEFGLPSLRFTKRINHR